VRARLLLAAAFNAILLLVMSASCTHASAAASADTPALYVKTSLDVLADVINPSSQIASEGCKARKEAITSAVEARTIAAPLGKAQLDQAIERCKALAQTFERMRSLHEEARMLLEHDQLTDAKARLGELREAWRGLRETGGGVP
jgi:hypothetical protein